MNLVYFTGCITADCDESIPIRLKGRGDHKKYCRKCLRRRDRERKSNQYRRIGRAGRERKQKSAVYCGCGRDYLTVPLSEAHICPNPTTVKRKS